MSLCYAVIFLLLFTKEISNNSVTSPLEEENDVTPSRGGRYSTNSTNVIRYHVGHNIWGDEAKAMQAELELGR
ncbi:hypothetical protein M8J75_002061 [Diaphorina citri]|nr:hypothetical protein M8J75_002061 [Diaphorina citri]KAI5727445.1 hypothetical protein M8J77_002396 [Diaphorina citri]